MKIKTTLLVVPVLLLLAACQTVQTTQGGVVGVDRQQMMMPSVSAAQMERAASAEYSQLIAAERAKGKVDQNAALAARVKTVSDRLIRQAPVFRPAAAQWQWQVHLLTSPEANAWCMPGGKIAVYSGLLEKLSLSDDELAAVIGHEIAHALREHARERASEQALASLGISLVSAAAGLGDLGQRGMEYAYMGLLGLPNSRLHETEADRIGVELAARAGFNPQAAISLWQKMAGAGGSQPIKFLSTHPSQQDRLADLRVYAERVMPLYQQAVKK